MDKLENRVNIISDRVYYLDEQQKLLKVQQAGNRRRELFLWCVVAGLVGNHIAFALLYFFGYPL